MGTKKLDLNGEKESDNIETIPELNETLNEWIETLELPFESMGSAIENFEFRSRDGFHAHSHNHGGIDLIAFSTVGYLIGSGEHFGLSIEKWVDDSYNNSVEYVKKEYPELVDGSDEFYEKLDDCTTDDYEGIAWRVRVMYEGNGVLTIYAGYDKDAPYYRWSNAENLKTEIKFKTISGLKRSLKSLTKKIEGAF